MSEEMINKVLAEVVKQMGGEGPAPSSAPAAPTAAPTPAAGSVPAVTEFVGTNALGDTIGLVIANVDSRRRNTAPSASSAPAPALARTSSPPTRLSRPPTPRSCPSSCPATPRAAPATAR